LKDQDSSYYQIVCRFGVLNRIITNNGFQFTSRVFQDYCEDLGVQICYASIAHPESIGQVERANAEILRGLKTHTYDCLKKHGAKWIDEHPCALWANWTSSSQTPEIAMVSPRVQAYDEAT
jgi:hypothetical protein